MLKFECNKGKISISGAGSTAELAADVITCIYSVWKNINDDKDTFKGVIKVAVNDDVPFSEKMKAAKEKVKAKNAYKVLDELKDLLRNAGFNTGDEEDETE